MKKHWISALFIILAVWGITDLRSNGVPLLDSILAIATIGLFFLLITFSKKYFDKQWEKWATLFKSIKKN